MSDDKILSQEEINALLGKIRLDDEGSSEELNVNDYLTPLEQDALGEIGNISLGNSATTLSILVRQEVDITTPQIDIIHLSKLKDEFPKPHVSVHVDYTDGFEGMNVLVVKEEDAKIIADLMMGGDGSPSDEPLSELHISAVQEAMNQMMGAAATSMSTLFNRLVNISPPGIEIMGGNAGHVPGFTEDIIIKVSFRLRIGAFIDSNIMQLIPLSFAKYMVQLLMGGEEMEAANQEDGREPAEVQIAAAVQDEHPVQQEPAPAKKDVPQPDPKAPSVSSVSFPSLTQVPLPTVNDLNLHLLLDIPLEITVELGRTTKPIHEILELTDGSIIELEKLAGEPVDILANNKLIARGEVVVIEENFGVRITEIANPQERFQRLN